jgi:hypothetical protein
MRLKIDVSLHKKDVIGPEWNDTLFNSRTCPLIPANSQLILLRYVRSPAGIIEQGLRELGGYSESELAHAISSINRRMQCFAVGHEW